MPSQASGHLIALFTVFIWGTTFISTKVLLVDFLPIEILFYRFLIGMCAMFVIYPRLMGFKSLKEESYFALAGLFGITLYFLFENIALTYSLASTVGILISVVPFFTAIVNRFFGSREHLQLHFFVGFIFAICGIVLMSLNTIELSINPLGDFLALLAALSWAFYSLLIKKACSFGYSNLQVTRCVFAYGLVLMIPMMYLMDFKFDLGRFSSLLNSFNILYLGVGASAICFVSWNVSLKILGVVKASAYIYAIPVITVISAMIILHERLTVLSSFGIVMTLLGLFISESNTLWARIFRRSKKAVAKE